MPVCSSTASIVNGKGIGVELSLIVCIVGLVGVPMIGVSSGCGNVMVVVAWVILTGTAAVAVRKS
jgi:hypothetical protein